MPTRSRPGPRRVRARPGRTSRCARSRAAGRRRPGRCSTARACPAGSSRRRRRRSPRAGGRRSWPSGVRRSSVTLLRPRPSTAQNSEYCPSSAVDERTDLAHEVAAARLLDLDDLGALLAEQSRAERRGDAGAEVEHAEARRADRSSVLGSYAARRITRPCALCARLSLADNSGGVTHELVTGRRHRRVLAGPVAVAVGALLAPVVACLRGDDDGVRVLFDGACEDGTIAAALRAAPAVARVYLRTRAAARRRRPHPRPATSAARSTASATARSSRSAPSASRSHGPTRRSRRVAEAVFVDAALEHGRWTALVGAVASCWWCAEPVRALRGTDPVERDRRDLPVPRLASPEARAARSGRP